ncbi:MAG: hypothetical protein WC760_05500 [Bacteroidia bacterium]|jgi:hypothetical protein
MIKISEIVFDKYSYQINRNDVQVQQIKASRFPATVKREGREINKKAETFISAFSASASR